VDFVGIEMAEHYLKKAIARPRAAINGKTAKGKASKRASRTLRT